MALGTVAFSLIVYLTLALLSAVFVYEVYALLAERSAAAS